MAWNKWKTYSHYDEKGNYKGRSVDVTEGEKWLIMAIYLGWVVFWALGVILAPLYIILINWFWEKAERVYPKLLKDPIWLSRKKKWKTNQWAWIIIWLLFWAQTWAYRAGSEYIH